MFCSWSRREYSPRRTAIQLPEDEDPSSSDRGLSKTRPKFSHTTLASWKATELPMMEKSTRELPWHALQSPTLSSPKVSMYFPDGQALQNVEPLLCPTTAFSSPYLPMGQFLQSAEESCPNSSRYLPRPHALHLLDPESAEVSAFASP